MRIWRAGKRPQSNVTESTIVIDRPLTRDPVCGNYLVIGPEPYFVTKAERNASGLSVDVIIKGNPHRFLIEVVQAAQNRP